MDINVRSSTLLPYSLLLWKGKSSYSVVNVWRRVWCNRSWISVSTFIQTPYRKRSTGRESIFVVTIPSSPLKWIPCYSFRGVRRPGAERRTRPNIGATETIVGVQSHEVAKVWKWSKNQRFLNEKPIKSIRRFSTKIFNGSNKSPQNITPTQNPQMRYMSIVFRYYLEQKHLQKYPRNYF